MFAKIYTCIKEDTVKKRIVFFVTGSIIILTVYSWLTIDTTWEHDILHGLGHMWPEILVTLCFYYFLEQGYKKYLSVPKDTEPTRADLIKELCETRRGENIRIMDTTLLNLLQDERVIDRLKNVFIENMKEGGLIHILLLHPDTEAARQRHNDLIRKEPERDFLQEMREGMRLIYQLHKEISDDNRMDKERLRKNFVIKFYKSTPPMVLYSIGEVAYFKTLPPYERSSSEKTWIKTGVKSDFCKVQLDRFYELLDSEDDHYTENVTSLEQLFYVTVHYGAMSSRMYWGGDSLNPLRPRYLMSEDGSFQDICNKVHDLNGNNHISKKSEFYLDIEFSNEKRRRIQVVRRIGYNRANSEYIDAYLKFCRVYGWLMEDQINRSGYRSDIFQIIYEKEHFDIQAEKNDIKKRLHYDAIGYAFLSHKQMDINLSTSLVQHWTIFSDCYNKLPVDDNELEYSRRLNDYYEKQIERRDKSTYVPKRRVMFKFAVNRVGNNWDFNELDADLDEIHYPGLFEPLNVIENITLGNVIDNKRIKSSRKLVVAENEKIRTWPMTDEEIEKIEILTKQRQSEELVNKYSQDLQDAKRVSQIERIELQKIKDFIFSIIRFDLFVINPEANNNVWTVYCQLIRHQVAKDQKSMVISERKTEQNFEYQVIHLIDRHNVAEGITTVNKGDKTKPTTYALEYSCDSFYKRGDVEFNVSDVRWAGGHDDDIGTRDVLVLDFMIGAPIINSDSKPINQDAITDAEE